MKKAIKIILKVLGILLALLVAGVIAAAIYFWPFISSVDWSIVSPNNIKALYVAFTTDTDTLDLNQKELDDKRAEDIKNYVNVDVRDFTEEELKQIESGEKTKTQIVAQIISESVENEKQNTYTENNNDSSQVTQGAETNTPEQNQTEQNTPTGGNSDAATNVTESADAIVTRHISNLYTIQNNFEARVSDLSVNARNWLHAYKKSTGVTWKEAKVAALKHFTSTASSIELECYAQVDAEVEALRAELEAIGADTSIVNTVKESAYQEMDIKKAKIVQEGTAKMNKE